ncbi:hypothetical protein HD806DRAFT_56333 [Xylariaceae sp. AK1471]|nr:hypothetical protein HD806DRAFT_56333 [Xylariaceae sp. AK1471]
MCFQDNVRYLRCGHSTVSNECHYPNPNPKLCPYGFQKRSDDRVKDEACGAPTCTGDGNWWDCCRCGTRHMWPSCATCSHVRCAKCWVVRWNTPAKHLHDLRYEDAKQHFNNRNDGAAGGAEDTNDDPSRVDSGL